ncbi:MAG: NADH-quinone oxidoreductase subunit B, partial [Ilumatobacteraceae bacterium]
MGIVDNVLSDGLGGLSHNVITGRIEDLVKWARSRSSWPASFGLACCAIEMGAAFASPRYDVMRLGVIPLPASPRQADLIVVSGTVTDK